MDRSFGFVLALRFAYFFLETGYQIISWVWIMLICYCFFFLQCFKMQANIRMEMEIVTKDNIVN